LIPFVSVALSGADAAAAAAAAARDANTSHGGDEVSLVGVNKHAEALEADTIKTDYRHAAPPTHS